MTNKLSIKSVLIAILLGISFLFLPCMMLSTTDNSTTYAVVSTKSLDDTSSVGLSNPNFTSTQSGSSSSLQSPSNWTTVNGNGIEPAYKGVADLSTSSFNNNKTKYGLENIASTFVRDKSASSSDNKVLLINAQNTATNYGYTNTSNFTLEADCFYEIKMFVYTSSADNNAFASIYLTGDDFTSTKLTNLNTFGSWKVASIFVSTNANKSSVAKLQLFLGEKNNGNSVGFVCFDNISVMRYSKAQYDIQKATCETGFYTEVNLNTASPITSGYGYIENGDFSSNLNGWENDGVDYVSNFDDALTINGEQKTINSNQRGDIKGVLLTANNSTASLKSSDFSVGRMKIYQISFWAKHSLSSGDAKFEIIGMPSDETALEPEEKSAAISSLTTGTSLNNYWTRYNLFITGDSRFDTTAYLKFTLGSSSTKATGYVAIANIQSFEITDSDKTTSTTTNSNNASLSMENSASLSFANSTFNAVTIEKDTLPSPNNWTALNTTNNESGVVNVKSENWENFAPVCPSKVNNYSDNVLMIHNSMTNSYQAYTSGTVSLSANNYAKLTFEAFTYGVNGNVWATLTDDNNNEIYKFNIDSLNKWTTYSFALKNYGHDISLKLTLYLGDNSSPATGFAFFDNCSINTSLTEDEFNALGNNFTKVDLSSDQLTANDNGTPKYLTASIDNQNAQYGVMKAQDFNLGVSKDSLSGPTDSQEEVLYIYSSTLTCSTLTTNFNYTFNADTYYKVSAKIKTIGIKKSDEYRLDDNENVVKYGATFMITGIDKYFTGINTRQSDKDLTIKQQFDEASNEWVEYILYINVSESVTGNAVFGLGNKQIKASGYVFFADFSVKTLTEDEYKSQTATYENELPFNVLLATPSEEDEEEKTEPTNFDSAAWFAIPTAIIAVAVLVAIFGYFIRKFKNDKPKKEKVADADYDRLHTLLKDVDKKERKTEVKHKITLLREELKLSQKYLAEETEELSKRKSGEVTDSDGQSIKQLEKSIETQKNKIAEIELDIKVLENEYQKIINKQK